LDHCALVQLPTPTKGIKRFGPGAEDKKWKTQSATVGKSERQGERQGEKRRKGREGWEGGVKRVVVLMLAATIVYIEM
jgi:hypothetical protein